MAALLSLLCFNQQAVAGDHEKVVIGVQDFQDYLPYSSYRDFNYQGFNRALLDRFGRFAKLDIEYRPMPIPRLYQALIDGDIDARYPDNPEWVLNNKPLDIHYSDPVVAYIDGALIRPEHYGQGFNQLTSLSMIRGYSRLYSYYNREQSGHLRILESANVEQLLNKVLNGQSRAGYMNITVAEHHLRLNQQATGALVFDPSLPYKRSFRYLSSRTKPQLIEHFNRFLIEQSEQLNALKAYHQVDKIPAQPFPQQVHLTSHNLPPYGSFAQDKALLTDADFTGIAIEPVRCALKALEIDLDITITPWKRAQNMVMNASADGFFAASQNTQRDSYAVLSGTIAEQKWQWFYLKDSGINPRSPKFKQRAHIGAFVGSNMLRWLEENDYPVKSRPQNTHQLLKMLLAGRIDAFLANDQVMNELLAIENNPEKIARQTQIDKPLGVYFRKSLISNFPTFLPAFNRAVAQCRQSD